ncbi:MAG TPA: hypothetical protein DGG94_20105 [Micromonosporaceae bacterium]|nr:hypothetical protein [Micromonosporaceae bacterium]HCU52068.1 hypothetical protein [Micromonosporaceae bacterium]
MAVVLAAGGTLAAAPRPAEAVTLPSAEAASSAPCVVSEILVNPCRHWLGARANDYPESAENFRAQTEYHEQRIGRKVDIAHTYSPVGSVPLSSKYDQYMAKRDGTYLFANWKPAEKWRDAGGRSSSVEARIDKAAANIKAIAPKKIFLTLHHEPENDVTTSSGCKTKPGTSGTPSEYRDMWKHVRERFDAKGVANVVWVMDYMNYYKWDCLVPKLYPGDKYVDWIMFNAYGSGGKANFVDNVTRFQKLLTSLDSPDRKLTSKPWGIVEWGVHDATQAQARSYYQQAAKALSENKLPNLHAYMIFDSPGTHDQGGLRIRYSDAGKTDLAEQDSYRSFANHPKLTG